MAQPFDSWVGIDYGSKMAGTTVICYKSGQHIHFLQSEKKSDADAFIAKCLAELQPQFVFLDAPLSLPSVYNGKGTDYFYRACDKETKAMSPMFLGGLTARAMRLDAQIKDVEFKETYPGYFVRQILELGSRYGKKGPLDIELAKQLADAYKLKLEVLPENWHQLDALCCYISGLRHHSGDGIKIGEAREGLIYV